MPTKMFTAESEVELSDLESSIMHSHVNDSILIYSLLKKNNVEISSDLMHAFLELVCYYNCEEPLEEDMIEERWFRQSEKIKERARKTWRDNDIADQVFHEMASKEPRTYSCMIRGMSKYFQVEKAWALYNDCLANNVPLDVEAFNAVLKIVTVLKESADLRWTLLLEILQQMKERKVDPNLSTMNSCLYTISNMGTRNARDYATQILSEFKSIGIEPSLGSYAYVLQTFCRDKGPVSHVLVDIMNDIEGKEFHIRDMKDTSFFVTAMDVCRNHIFDLELAKRVDSLLHVGENYNLIGDSYRESIYYRNYFSLLVLNEPFEKFMSDYYFNLVPHVYIPEQSVMEDILKAVEVSGAIEHIPLLWSHLICFDQIMRENLLTILFRVMLQNKPDETIKTQENLTSKFCEIAWDVWTKIEEKNEQRSKPLAWTGKLLSDILRFTCLEQDINRASDIMNKLMNDQQKILGEPEFISMQEYVDLCILKKQPSKAIQCLQYCTEIGFNESKDLAKKICKEFTLDENHMKKIVYFVGPNILKELEQEEQAGRTENVNQ
jgi:pentatricopeptide repeat domain-containing protein 3